jgi:hypothetical protein
MKRGAILDRALDPGLMDAGVESLLNNRSQPQAAGSSLENALEELIQSKTARKKVRTVLSRIWLRPPAEASAMIRWAGEQSVILDDRRVLYLAALMGTHPFFAEACAIVGRQLLLDRVLRTDDLKRKLRAQWGDREVVDVSARGAIRTLRSFDVLHGSKDGRMDTLRQQLTVAADLFGFVVHCLLLGRGWKEIDAREIAKSPELFMFELPNALPNGYPYLERFTEGGGRVVFQRRESAG